MVPQKTPLLLDLAPGAAAAFSLRQLSNSYAGPVVTVRRSTDNAEADFTANEIDNGDLASWCMGGDGFVKQWWDQSGNTGRDATQTQTARQAKIVSAGVVILEGGKPALKFDGIDDWFSVPSSTATFAFLHKLPSATFAVIRFSDSANPGIYQTLMANGGEASTLSGVFFSFNDVSVNNGLTAAVTRRVSGTNTVVSTVADVISPTEQGLLSILLDPANVSASGRLTHYFGGAFVDDANASVLSVYEGDASKDLMIGAYPPGNAGFVSGTISELLIYPRDMTAERQLIEGNMAWYY